MSQLQHVKWVHS